jgi:hypothetical protein
MKTKLIKKINKQKLLKTYRYINSPQDYMELKVIAAKIRRYLNKTTK